MKIVICASIHFVEKIREIEKALKERGHDVLIPGSIEEFNVKNTADDDNLRELTNDDHSIKQRLTIKHFDKIDNADAILVINEKKRGIPNYVGGAVFAEMMFAMYKGKKIFLLNPIPDHEKIEFFKDEIEGTDPIIINGNLDLVK